ncbi:MAG: ATP-binding cassette domain-containing protein, partial [Burkholderiales bacterium]
MSEALVSLEGVSVRLGSAGQVAALSSVNLQLRPGERLALVGANGSGKSTLLRCLHGLLPVSGGQMRILPGLKMAMLFQRPHLLRLSLRRNVALGLWLAGVPWSDAGERAAQALGRVGLEHLASRSGRALSGGQQQRAALARAWALRPDVWLLDEPTASLDPHAKREVEALIAEFGQEAPDAGRRRPSFVFASHNLGQVKRLASRVIYLEQGRVLADLAVHDFFNQEKLAAISPEASTFV